MELVLISTETELADGVVKIVISRQAKSNGK